jgi:transposase
LCFSEDITATAAAKLVKVNRKTVNNYYKVLRETILKETLKETPRDEGGFELEEPYFGGKRGRGAAGKTPVFGLAKRGGKVFVKIVKNCSKEELLPVIQGKILEKSVIYTGRLEGL